MWMSEKWARLLRFCFRTLARGSPAKRFLSIAATTSWASSGAGNLARVALIFSLKKADRRESSRKKRAMVQNGRRHQNAKTHYRHRRPGRFGKEQPREAGRASARIFVP